MKSKIFFLILLNLPIFSFAYASYPQRVAVCLNVINNNTPISFQAGFISSDFFDSYSYTEKISNGQSCTKPHLYKQGPKDILLKAGRHIVPADGPQLVATKNNQDLLINKDASCSFLKPFGTESFQSGKLSTQHPQEYWTINFTKAPPIDGYKYAFNMHCEHIAY